MLKKANIGQKKPIIINPTFKNFGILIFSLAVDRLPRRSSETPQNHPTLLTDSDLSRLPLPDLVLSAVEHLPSPSPQVTVSAPSSPTRDSVSQFPEYNVFVSGSKRKPRRKWMTYENPLTEKNHECSTKSHSCCKKHCTSNLGRRGWITVGANLRNIAHDFQVSKTKVIFFIYVDFLAE